MPADSVSGGCLCGAVRFEARLPGELHICLSNILGEIDREPEGHVFYDSHVSWLELADELPRQL